MLHELNMYPNRNSWAKSVKIVLENLGVYNVTWLNQGNESLFLNMFKQRMRDNYLQDWNNEIENSPRVTYRLFCSFGLETYLKCVKIEKFIFALCRFRVSAQR